MNKNHTTPVNPTSQTTSLKQHTMKTAITRAFSLALAAALSMGLSSPLMAGNVKDRVNRVIYNDGWYTYIPPLFPRERTLTDTGGRQLDVTINSKSATAIICTIAGGKVISIPLSTLSAIDLQFLAYTDTYQEALLINKDTKKPKFIDGRYDKNKVYPYPVIKFLQKPDGSYSYHGISENMGAKYKKNGATVHLLHILRSNPEIVYVVEFDEADTVEAKMASDPKLAECLAKIKTRPECKRSLEKAIEEEGRVAIVRDWRAPEK